MSSDQKDENEYLKRETVFNIITTFIIGVILIVTAGELSHADFLWSGMVTILRWIGICLLCGSLVYGQYIFKVPVLTVIKNISEQIKRGIVKKTGDMWKQRDKKIFNKIAISGIIIPACIGIVLITFNKEVIDIVSIIFNKEFWIQFVNWKNYKTIVLEIGSCLIIWSVGYAIYLKIKSKKEIKKNP